MTAALSFALSFLAADHVGGGDLALILLILAIVCFAGAVYLALVVNNYVGAIVAVVLGVILLVVA